jgi:hypothetical protein
MWRRALSSSATKVLRVVAVSFVGEQLSFPAAVTV